MGSLMGRTVYYFCVSKGNRIVYSYNRGDRELDSLAALCIENAPSFHAWYFQTMRGKTFGFLMEDGGHIYFAIADPSLENSRILRFLEHIRDRYNKASKSGVQEEFVPVIQCLISSLENVSRCSIPIQVAEKTSLAGWVPARSFSKGMHELPSLPDEMPERPPSTDGMISTRTLLPQVEAPLLGTTSSKLDRKKMKDRAIDIRDIGIESHSTRGIRIDCPPEPMHAISLQKSSSSSRTRGQQKEVARRLWCRQVRIIIAVDVILCLVLFGVWLAVCKGFQCVK